MNSIIFTFAVVVVNLATFVACDNFSDSELACLKKTDISEDEVNAFFHDGMKPADAKENVQCFVKCVMENEGYIKNGLLLVDQTVRAFKQSPELKDFPNLEKVVSDCKNEKGANDCETAFKIMLCFANNKLNLHE